MSDVSRKINGQFIYIVCGILFLLLSNHYITFETTNADILASASDSFSYVSIAQHAPQLFGANEIPQHHAERFVIPYLIGMVGKLLNSDPAHLFLPFVILAYFFQAGLLTAIAKNQFKTNWAMTAFVLTSIFNPYATRLYLTFPWLIVDVVFLLALSIFVLGVVSSSGSKIILGVLLGTISRQTTFAIFPAIALLALFRRDLRKACCLSFLVAIIVQLSIKLLLASHGWHGSIAQHIFGLFIWAKTEFSFAQLLGFLFKGFSGYVAAIAVLAGILMRKAQTCFDRTDAVILLSALGIIAQPVLAGPTITEGNLPRLACLALIPIHFVLFKQVQNFDVSKNLSAKIFFALSLAMISFHHIFWGWKFGIAFSAVSFVVAQCLGFLFYILSFRSWRVIGT